LAVVVLVELEHITVLELMAVIVLFLVLLQLAAEKVVVMTKPQQ